MKKEIYLNYVKELEKALSAENLTAYKKMIDAYESKYTEIKKIVCEAKKEIKVINNNFYSRIKEEKKSTILKDSYRKEKEEKDEKIRHIESISNLEVNEMLLKAYYLALLNLNYNYGVLLSRNIFEVFNNRNNFKDFNSYDRSKRGNNFLIENKIFIYEYQYNDSYYLAYKEKVSNNYIDYYSNSKYTFKVSDIETIIQMYKRLFTIENEILKLQNESNDIISNFHNNYETRRSYYRMLTTGGARYDY